MFTQNKAPFFTGDATESVSDLKIVFCSIPVEGIGSKLDRGRDEGSLGIVPKVAIVALVNWLEENGYNEKNWDFLDIDMMFPSDDWIREYFRMAQPDIVALSAVVSTSFSQVKRISKIVREECPDCWIEMGGNLAASAEPVLYETDVDVVFAGDGEISFLEFVKYVEKYGTKKKTSILKTLPGICLIDENNSLFFQIYGPPVKANQLVLPDYRILERGLRWTPEKIDNYFRSGASSGWFTLDERAFEKGRKPNIAGIFASKGCVARCTFCQRNTKSYRVHPYEELDSHLKYLKKEKNVGFIQILDENFGSNKSHSYEFAKILWENDMLWMATGVRCTSIEEEDIIFYKQHGCSALKFGIESGSQTILDVMEKFFTLEDVVKRVKLCIKHKIYSPLAVMVGMPGETEITAMETGKLLGEVAAELDTAPHEMGYDIFYALPLPGTPLYEYGEKIGIIDTSPKGTAAYLERVTDAGTYKRYYVNLNGAHESEVVFWDVLVALEASRTFKKLFKIKNGQGFRKSNNKVVESRLLEKKNNPRFSLKYTALKFTFITYFIDNNIIGNEIVDKLPRWLIYPLIKWANYLEFVIQSLNKNNTNNNIFAMRGASISRLDTKFQSTEKNPKRKSLRAVCSDMEYKNSYIETLDEKHKLARKLLVNGL